MGRSPVPHHHLADRQQNLGGDQKENQLFAIGALRFGSEDKPHLKDSSQ